ncbi:conjugative transposon protein TraM [uncultured Croceitalea sp.]|uniref:conjugative transposon protein TraM n=1 Tax=uncultured Croceitalea sp. TaxID=1798908 RepID=UPI00374FC3F2
MKIDKKKITFAGIIGLVVVFIICYSVFVLGDDGEAEIELTQPTVPELKEEQKEYNSKLDAINDLKEVRESNAPSIYDESLLDSSGQFDPLLKEKRRQQIVDSIYREGRIDYDSGNFRDSSSARVSRTMRAEKKNQDQPIAIDFKKAHDEFFNFEPSQEMKANPDNQTYNTDAFILVEVNGEQTVKKDSRLELRLAVDAVINGVMVSRNSLVFGFVSFKSNRVFVNITNIDHKPVKLKAFDLLDGNEGIYVRNSFTSDASREVIGDVVEDINIPGVPQVGGIKQVFRRNNQNVKATIYNQYQLIIKPSL